MRKYLLQIMLCLSVLFAFAGSEDVVHDTIIKHNISIVTYNVKMLPRGATFLHHHPVKRAKVLPNLLIQENPDVIVLQECYDGLAVRTLYKGLKSRYPYFMGNQNRKVVTYKRAGGVLMFSKYPMKEVECIRYKQCKGIDCAAAKGAMLVEVQHPAAKFQLLGTHMQAGGKVALKLSQYQEVGELLRRNQHDGIPQFACGDFNTPKANAELYPKLIDALNMEDGELTGDLKFTSDHLLNDMYDYNPNKRRVIDYVLLKRNGITPLTQTRSVKAFQQQWNPKHKDLSDHFALVYHMTL